MRTLRRPMFKIGGKAKSGNDGIMDGLVDREQLQEGTALEKFKSIVLGPRYNDPEFKSPLQFQSGTGFEFMSPERQSPGLAEIGEGIKSRDTRLDSLGIDELAKPVRYSPGQEKAMAASDLAMGEGDLLDSDLLKGETGYVSTELGKNDNVKNILDIDNEINKKDGSNQVTAAEKKSILEARAKEFEELLNPGARKRVINNALAQASAAFGKSTGDTKQDLANAITAAAGATSAMDETKRKAAELAIGESIQTRIAGLKNKDNTYETLLKLANNKTRTEGEEALFKKLSGQTSDSLTDLMRDLGKSDGSRLYVNKKYPDVKTISASQAKSKEFKPDSNGKVNVPNGEYYIGASGDEGDKFFTIKDGVVGPSTKQPLIN